MAVNLDSQLVEQSAFAAPNVTLYSPAFMPNASFDAGWFKGTEGATSHDQLGAKTPDSSRMTELPELSLTLTQKHS